MLETTQNKNDNKEIGGYFELEMTKNGNIWHQNAIALNSARSGFQYILASKKPSKVYLPNYICNSMLQPLQNCGIQFGFYNIDENLEIIEDFILAEKDMVLYVNYFGVKSTYCKFLSDKYRKNLIIDNSQAFFELPINRIDSIYSPRKFFGVGNGGFLYTDLLLKEKMETDYSFENIAHLVGRIEKSAHEFYSEFRRSEASLSNQPIKKMSKFTHIVLQNIDYEKVKITRERNFLFLHNKLKNYNLLELDLNCLNGPMVYPYLTNDNHLRERLIQHKIYVAKYWEEVMQRPSGI